MVVGDHEPVLAPHDLPVPQEPVLLPELQAQRRATQLAPAVALAWRLQKAQDGCQAQHDPGADRAAHARPAPQDPQPLRMGAQGLQ